MSFAVGQQVSWHYMPRGGYGFGYPVDGEVVSVGPKHVRIRVKHRSGEMKVVAVDPASLRAVAPERRRDEAPHG